MTRPNFFILEFRPLVVTVGLAFTCWLITADWKLSGALCVACLALYWGWQLAKLYQWFADPDDVPPIGGSGVRGVLHDVYVLRSRPPASPRGLGVRGVGLGAAEEGARPHVPGLGRRMSPTSLDFLVILQGLIDASGGTGEEHPPCAGIRSQEEDDRRR